MEVIEILKNGFQYKIYKIDEDEQHFLNFKKGDEVLPARYYDNESINERFFFLHKHEPNTPYWRDGGYECVNSLGGLYCFHFDTLILHPKYFEKKKKNTLNVSYTRSNKGKRGRSNKNLKNNNTYIPTGGKRGRPKKDENDLKSPKIYIPTGGKRGRPKKDENDLKPPKIYIPTGGKRGRPKK
jgi:hypothetical protein